MYFMDESEALDPIGSQLPELIPGFCSMMRLGEFLLPLHGRDAFPSNLPVPIYTPGWREAL